MRKTPFGCSTAHFCLARITNRIKDVPHCYLDSHQQHQHFILSARCENSISTENSTHWMRRASECDRIPFMPFCLIFSLVVFDSFICLGSTIEILYALQLLAHSLLSFHFDDCILIPTSFMRSISNIPYQIRIVVEAIFLAD